MNLIQILAIILLLKVISSIVLDPICKSCLQIDQNLVTIQYRQDLKTNLTLFRLPGFSLSSIYIDYRHLKEFPSVNNQVIFELYFEITDLQSGDVTKSLINDSIIGTNQYQLTTTEQLNFQIIMFVKDQYQYFEYLLRESISLKLSYANNRLPTQDSSYLFVVQSQDNINLPVNKPDLTNIKNFYLQNQRVATSLLGSSDTTESTTYWSTQSLFVVPYFPYFSNCQGQGNIMHIMQSLQNTNDCTLIPIDETVWISQFNFGSSAKADKCSIKRKCTIYGAQQKTEYPDWQTLPTLLTLFSITQEKIYWSDYQYNTNFESQSLVACKIYQSSGSNSSSMYPLKVKMTMGYYQVSQTQKRIINCQIDYDLYVESTANFTYQLEIVSYPLNHTYIMLNFGFKWYVYMIVFLIIGIIGNFENFLIWVYHYFVAEQRKQIKLLMYFKIIKEILKGTIMALILEMLIIFIVSAIMNAKIFTTTFYDQSDNGSPTPRVLFDYMLEDPINDYDSAEMQNLRSGRMGISFVTIGVMIILLECHYFIGKQKKKEQYKDFQILGRVFKPLQWNRGKFLFGTFFFIALQYFFIYFAYSTIYSTNIWTFIVLMKVLQVILQQITKSVYDDILPGLPLKIITDITAYVITISAADLYDFLFGSLLDVAITMIQKIYIFQVQNIAVQKIQQKSQQLNKFYINMMNQQDGEDQDAHQKYGNCQNEFYQNQDQKDNQHVFIYRQAQEVEFFEEDINQIYAYMRNQDEKHVINMCKQTEEQKRIRKKYFDSLQKDYIKQRELLFKGKQGLDDDKVVQKKQGMENSQAQKQEQMQKQSAIFQVLLDHIAMIYTFLINPFVVFIFWITFDQSAVLQLFGIVYNTVVLYILSALVIGVFSVFNIIMIFHIIESYMGFSFQEQITDVLSRFDNRKTFWKADQQCLNQKLKPENRGADHYCLSSQLFFILTVYVGGMILVILGLAIIFNANYNFFSDIATLPNIAFWAIVIYLFRSIVIKVAILLNIWDYSKYKEQQNDPNHNKLNGIQDFKLFQQDSDYKTQNILFVDDVFIEKFKKYDLKKNIDKSPSTSFSLKGTNPKIQLKNQSKKNKFQLKKQYLKIQSRQGRDQILLAHKRLEIICKKLQPLFSKQSFKYQYSIKNKQFIKQNIQKILPLVDFLPQLQEFKNMQNLLSSSHNQQSSKIDSKRQTLSSKKQQSMSNKNMDPVIAEIILQWLRATQKSKMKRISNGLQQQSKFKKCSFCYSTWGLYYGHEGTCLECSMRIASEKQSSQNESNLERRKSADSSSSKINKRNSKNKDRLNVITEEDGFEDQNDIIDEEDQNSSLNPSDNVSGKKLHMD